jgi:hypothetical protein
MSKISETAVTNKLIPSAATTRAHSSSPRLHPKRRSLLRMVSTIAPAIVLSFGFVATGALGASAHTGETQIAARPAVRTHSAAQSSHLHRIAGNEHARPGYARRVEPMIQPPAWTHDGPAYFVPGRGIVGESCDLPTSACSNEERIED